MNPPSPREYGLPHDEWRPGQHEMVEWTSEQKGIVILEAPTGTGKTAVPAAIANGRSVLALVKTKTLQAQNYGHMYGFDVLFGRSNYECVLVGADGRAASDCAFAEVGMGRCPQAEECPYLLQKATVKASGKVSLNYAYYLTAPWVRENPPHLLCLDEADELPDIVYEHAGITLTERQRVEWSLPPFPRISGATSLLESYNPTQVVMDWLGAARSVLRATYQRLMKGGSRELRSRCEELGMKVSHTLNAMALCSSDWYIRAGMGVVKTREGRVPGLICKPLTARYHFPALFDVSPTVLLMSATIGSPEPLAKELGIKEFAFKSMPNAWPADQRAIHAPKDIPRVGAKATALDYQHQADLVAQAIKGCPPDWAGVILVTSKKEAGEVADRLARRGLQDRVWVIPEKIEGRYVGTDIQTQAWEDRKQQVPGSIMVSWAHWRGWDGLDERFLGVLKVPFPVRGEPGSYEDEWMRYSRSMYQWRAANMLAQGCGRTRRGRPQDYGDQNKWVGVFDANWTMVKKHLPAGFLEAVVQ